MVDEPVITNVYEFPNGMCMVFDQYGKQMPEFQGRTEEMREKIREKFSGQIKRATWL